MKRMFTENGFDYQDEEGPYANGIRPQAPHQDPYTRRSLAIGDPALSHDTRRGEVPEDPSRAPGRYEIDWRRIIRNFTCSWFTVNMGTGVVSIVLHQMPKPYDAHWLRILGIIVFIFNLVLFILFSVITTARFIMYPEVLDAIMRGPGESLFLGAFPIGLATLINMFVYVCVQNGHWGGWATGFAWAWFWADAVMALACAMVVPFFM